MSLATIAGQAIREASAAAQQVGAPAYGPPIAAARVLAGLIVPALRQISTYNQQPRFYTHPDDLTTAATLGVQAQGVIQVTSQSDFLWTALSVTNGPNGVVAQTYTLQLLLGSTDRNFVSRPNGVNPVHFISTQIRPYVLPKAFVLAKNVQLTVTITNTAATAIANGQVVLHGFDNYDVNVIDATRQTYGAAIPA